MSHMLFIRKGKLENNLRNPIAFWYISFKIAYIKKLIK